MKRKHIIRACLLLFCLLLCTACRSESKPKETRFSFVSEDSLTIVNAEGQELRFANGRWDGTMPVLDRHFTVDFVPGSTSAQVRFSEAVAVRLEPVRAKDRSSCLSFDGDDFRAGQRRGHGVDRACQYRHAAQQRELFGQGASAAYPAASGHDDCSRACHAVILCRRFPPAPGRPFRAASASRAA